MKIAQSIEVKISLGLHVRPAMEVAQILQQSQCKASITYEKKTINAESMISLLSLAAPCGAVLSFNIEGVDAKETLQKIIAALS